MRRLTEAQKQDLCDLMARFVAIESINRNPEAARRDRAEERMARCLTEHLQGMGMAVEARDYQPGRPNLIAQWPDQGSPGARSLALSAHMDTVTVDGMTVDPFQVTYRDGRAYGRGTCDTKGPMAAYLTALAIARRDNRLPADKVYFVATCAEETCCEGSTALMKTGFRTDAAIVAEATSCRVVSSHKGPLWLALETRGRSCHASIPDQGVNAIETMSRVIQFVHGPWQEHIRRTSHPLLGRSTMSVTLIDGGNKINIIPASCRAEMDGRFIPGEPADQVVEDFQRMLAAYLGGRGDFAVTRQEAYPPLNCPPDAPICRHLTEVCRRFNGQAAPLGVNYFADTGPFDQAGIQSVLFGPGDIAQAHTADEYIELEQLYECAEILLTLLTSHAGSSVLA
jgi:acetylornithine deacetylase